MASEIQAGRPALTRLKSTRSGAVSQNVVFVFAPELDQAAYGAFLGSGFEAVQVMSPINSAGAADVRIQAGRGFDYILPGGGNVVTVPGPVQQLKLTPLNAAVAGSGSDDMIVTPLARMKTGSW